MAFIYDRKSHRYRDSVTGQWVAQKTLLDLSANFIAEQARFADGLAARVAIGMITPDAFLGEMRAWIKLNYLSQFMLGRGGRNAVDQSEWGRLGKLVDTQYKYAANFARDIANGVIANEKISDRVKMYAETSHEAYWLGTSRSWDVDLPAVPADGSTSCGSRCRCTWHLREVDKGKAVEATWELGAAANHCGDCNDRATSWSPLRIDRPT